MKLISGNPFLKKQDGKIIVDSVAFDDIINQFKTPLIVFLENRIRENIGTFREVFSSEFDLECYYSLKANFLPDICKIILSEGIGVELVNLPELKLVLDLGFPPNKIIIGGPYLSKELLELSINNKVKEIIVYNINDLQKVNSIAKKSNIVQDICIRVNSQKFESKLGVNFDNKTLIKIKKVLNDNRNIQIKSILSHYSTQMNNANQFRKNIKAIASSLRILSETGIKIDNINLGGGFPEATVMPKDQLKNIAKEIKNALNEFEIDYKILKFEPGRYFVGDAGLIITKIINVSEDRWVFLNIGNHICPKFARCSLRFYNASQIDEPHKYKTSLAGIIPTDQDVLAKDYFFTEKLKKGDKVLVTNTGAYCLTFSNRFPYTLPKILLIKNNNLHQIFDPILDGDFSIS